MNTSGVNRIFLKFTGGNSATFLGDAGTGEECAVALSERTDDAHVQHSLIVGPYLDSPNTTSATTYTVQWWVSGHTAQLGIAETQTSEEGRGMHTVSAMKIGA